MSESNAISSVELLDLYKIQLLCFPGPNDLSAHFRSLQCFAEQFSLLCSFCSPTALEDSVWNGCGACRAGLWGLVAVLSLEFLRLVLIMPSAGPLFSVAKARFFMKRGFSDALTLFDNLSDVLALCAFASSSWNSSSRSLSVLSSPRFQLWLGKLQSSYFDAP